MLDYVISVWVGNVDGEGCFGLMGIKVVVLFFFDFFCLLFNLEEWFKLLKCYFKQVFICVELGFRFFKLCFYVILKVILKICWIVLFCFYYVFIYLERIGIYWVDVDCEDVVQLKYVVWFVLLLFMERYYCVIYLEYKMLSLYNLFCRLLIMDNLMYLVYL